MAGPASSSGADGRAASASTTARRGGGGGGPHGQPPARTAKHKRRRLVDAAPRASGASDASGGDNRAAVAFVADLVDLGAPGSDTPAREAGLDEARIARLVRAVLESAGTENLERRVGGISERIGKVVRSKEAAGDSRVTKFMEAVRAMRSGGGGGVASLVSQIPKSMKEVEGVVEAFDIGADVDEAQRLVRDLLVGAARRVVNDPDLLDALRTVVLLLATKPDNLAYVADAYDLVVNFLTSDDDAATVAETDAATSGAAPSPARGATEARIREALERCEGYEGDSAAAAAARVAARVATPRVVESIEARLAAFRESPEGAVAMEDEAGDAAIMAALRDAATAKDTAVDFRMAVISGTTDMQNAALLFDLVAGVAQKLWARDASPSRADTSTTTTTDRA